MEVEDSVSFDLLFKENYDSGNAEIYLSLIRKCIAVSENETKILRAIEVGFEFCIQFLSPEELEGKLFEFACPAAKSLFLNKLKVLQSFGAKPDVNVVPGCLESLDVCIRVVSNFLKTFDHLKDLPKITNSQVGSLLLNSSQLIYFCFQHCNESEKTYGSNRSHLADSLKNLFKIGCDLQEQLLNFLTDKLLFEFVEEKEEKILNEIFMYISKSGIALINLEAKTMAKVWKSYLLLVEKYSTYLENENGVGETINYLCSAITSAAETILSGDSGALDFNRSIKIACFLLKIVIKLCENFNHCLKGCQSSLLNLLLTLCKCNSFQLEGTHSKISEIQDLVNQLTVGTDPLMSQLISNEDLIRECTRFSKDLLPKSNVSSEFLILSCLIMKKLMHTNSVTRSLWFNEHNNILDWMFHCASCSQFEVCQSIKTTSVLLRGNYKKINNLYEYVLITASAYLMTMTSADFILVEKSLLKSVMQPRPVTAVLAIDIWCLLARLAPPDLCFTQVLGLSHIFQLSTRDKLYLRSLIRRLVPLLTESQRKIFSKSFKPSFYLELWGGDGTFGTVNDFTMHDAYYINSSIVDQLNKSLNICEMVNGYDLETEMDIKRDDVISEELENRIIKLWRFNCTVLSSCSQKAWFLKLACSLVSFVIRGMRQENLFMILCQIKKLLARDEEPCIKLYFLWVLNSLSTVRLTASPLQRNIITSIAEIFHILLLSKDLVVKEKVLETFYGFSHVTVHTEAIALSVQDPSISKIEIANYFQRKPPDEPEYDLNEYLGVIQKVELHQVSYPPSSPSVETFEYVRESSIDAEGLINRWKQDGETILKYVDTLTEVQKSEIRYLASVILSTAN